MRSTTKFIRSIRIYLQYFYRALSEIYLYYTSLYPIHIILKKWSLANKAIRILRAPPHRGKKPINQETIDLILEMKKLNPTWGIEKISNELAIIGYYTCPEIVRKYLEIYGLNNPSPQSKLSWKEFLNNYRFKIAIDFTSLISLMGHQLYVFVMIDLDSRKLIAINATYFHNRKWLIQQFTNAFFDMDHYPTLCICDGDRVFQDSFGKILKDYFGVKLRGIPFRYPQANGHVERFHLSLKSEGFRNIVPINLKQSQRICSEYKKYYNHHRTHQGIAGKIPAKENKLLDKRLKFIKTKHLGGKIISFDPDLRAAA